LIGKPNKDHAYGKKIAHCHRAEAPAIYNAVLIEELRHESEIGRREENYHQEETAMSEFRNKLKELDDDALDDAAAAVSREKARRSQRPVDTMTDAQFLAWSTEQIRQAEAAKEKEQADGE
jgi:hypothetical protein